MEGDVNHYVEGQEIVFGMEYNVFVMMDSFKLQLDVLQIVLINNISLMINALIIVNLNFKHLLLVFVNAPLVMKE